MLWILFFCCCRRAEDTFFGILLLLLLLLLFFFFYFWTDCFFCPVAAGASHTNAWIRRWSATNDGERDRRLVETRAASCFSRHSAVHVACFPNVISSTTDWSLFRSDDTLWNEPVFGTKKVTAALIRQEIVNRGLWRDAMKKRFPKKWFAWSFVRWCCGGPVAMYDHEWNEHTFWARAVDSFSRP